MSDVYVLNARLYVIGDIHGRADLLEQMIEKIRQDAKSHTGKTLTVTLGDYIDRGPNSHRVLDRLIQNPFPDQYVPLKGNHEALLEAFLDDPILGRSWLRIGGLQTLHSYGIFVERLLDENGCRNTAERLRALIPSEHLQFLASLKTSLIYGDYFFCHAGVRPGVPLKLQSEKDLLWIRNEFLGSDVNFGKVVVHGHTPAERPEMFSNRINIDTGAFTTGRLTCLVLEGKVRRFLGTEEP